MYTCKVCNYALTISKVTSQDNATVINTPAEFVKLFVKPARSKKTVEIDVDMVLELPFELDALNTQINKNGYKPEIASMLTEKFTNIKKNTRPNTFCLKCTQCNENFVLPPGKIMSIKLKKTNELSIDNIADIVGDYTFPRTKDFICPNDKCKTKDHEKEAILYRPNPDDYTTNYICVNCHTIF
jgi:hypothetical protein